jgi:hypothetical protein
MEGCQPDEIIMKFLSMKHPSIARARPSIEALEGM